MYIYSKYIQAKLLFFFIIIYCVFISIIWLTQSLRFLELITISGVDFFTFINITGFLILPMTYVCIPISLLFACIVTFSTLESNNEFIVLKSSGISNLQIYRSIMGVVILIFIIHISISLYLLPKSYKSFKSMQYTLREKLINATFEEGVFNNQSNSITIYVDKKDGNFKYKNIFIYDQRNSNKPVTIMANSGELIETEEGPGFILYDGTHQSEDKADDEIKLGFFDTYHFVLKLDINQNVPRAIDINELFLSDLLSVKNKNTTLVEQHIVHASQRIMWPLFNLILPLIVISGMLNNLSNRNSVFKKQFIVSIISIVIMAVLLVLNNMSLKVFNYFYVTLVVVIIITIYSFKKVNQN